MTFPPPHQQKFTDISTFADFFSVRVRSLGCWESLLVYHAPPLPQRLANRGVDSLEAFPGRIDVAEAARHRGGERRCRGGRAQRQILWGHRLLLLLLYPGHIHRGGGRTAMQRHHLAIAGGLSVAAAAGQESSGRVSFPGLPRLLLGPRGMEEAL